MTKENKIEKKDTKVRYLYALPFLIIRNVSNKGNTKLTNKKNEIIIMQFIAFHYYNTLSKIFDIQKTNNQYIYIKKRVN